MKRLILAVSALAGIVQPAPALAAPPDILLIMPDQMRGDGLSLVGHPVVQTPNIDRLAREGALFRRAYSTVPSCIPARFALLTGMTPQKSGVVGFRSRPLTEPTLPALLGAAGYRTVLVGRNMHQAPPNNSVGYQQEILGSTYVDGDEYDTELRRLAPQSGGIRKLVASLGVTYNHWQAKPWPLPDEMHPTAWVVRRARKAIADAPSSQPLFLTASFYSPHPPLFPPPPRYEANLKKNLPGPARGDWVDWPSIPANGDKAGHRIRLEGDILRQAQAGYFGLIEQIDGEIAPLIEEFRQRSMKAGREWIVVFTSDHGEMLGDHGFFRKCEPYEGSANIPLVFAASKGLGWQKGLRSMQPVGLEDIAPTLLAAAGVPCPDSADGVSLVRVLRGDTTRIREVLHAEHAPCYSPDQAFHMLTDGRHKYIWRPSDGTEQLFDLERDPCEVRDLARDAAHRGVVESWRARLVERLKDRPEGFSDGRKLIPGRPYPAIMKDPPGPRGDVAPAAATKRSDIRKLRVACVGDSTTQGAGAENRTKQSYPAQLQAMLGDGYAVENLGVGGCTLIRKGRPNVWDTLRQIQRQDVKPDIVIVNLGINDTCGGTRKCWDHKDDFPGDYRDFIDELKALAALSVP